MLPLDHHHPDRIQIAFDDHRLVANAGLLLPVTLAHHLGLRELVDNHVDLADAPGRANAGDKMLTLVASALAGGDCIDDADVLRKGRANTARGAAHFLRETVGRVRYAGARGQLTVRAEAASISAPWSRSAARWMSATPSPSASTPACGT